MKDQGRATHSLTVYRAEDLTVVRGANLGDAMGPADDVMLDEVYHLSPGASQQRLAVLPSGGSPLTIAQGSGVGAAGADLHLDCCVTLMSGDGDTVDVLVLVETDEAGDIAAILLLPLGGLRARMDYAVVGISREAALRKFAQIACVSFTGGTMITLASGAQKPVEDLRVGDLVLTRDDGAQEIRWLGHQTVRAAGAFAPVLIRAGVLNNLGDLLVSPDHRLFIYQRQDHLGAGRSEILVRAKHLVNGVSVTRAAGGFVDYYQMLLDHHQIVYAEGIAAESMLVDDRTSAALPRDIEARISHLLPGHSKSDQGELEVQEALLRRPDVAELLRRSSRC